MPKEREGDAVTKAPARQNVEVLVECGSSPDVREGDVQVPPVQPVIATLWTIEEVNQLPEGSVVIWTDSLDEVRQAAVVRLYEGQRSSMEHTISRSYWVDGLDMIEYPALALTWPAAGNSALEPSGHDSPE